jgi:hypothetical protein
MVLRARGGYRPLMTQVVHFPTDRMERANARTFILDDDADAPIDFGHVLRRLEEIIREKQRAATDPARIIDFELYRGMYRPARSA